jgi:hypothetical protein
MQKLTIEWIKENGLLVFEVISGSRSYGLHTETSDTDIKGVFVLPKDMFYGLEYTAQVNNASNDIVYYELKRFVELLSKNNPNILEMLNVPEDCILYKNPVMELLQQDMFLSKLCEYSFANYAFTQIRKAYGLEKKIVQAVEAERRSVHDFCFVYEGKSAVPLMDYLSTKNMDHERMGLTAVPHLRDCYNLFFSEVHKYSGITKKDNANDVALSSIPKGEQPVGLLFFNKDGYSVYCKQYKSYWELVEKRNEDRYNTTMSHGKRYDSKNMMHVFRLLLVAKEIATEGKVNVLRKDREHLLAIKAGKFEYDELLEQAAALKEQLPLLYQNSGLIDEPDLEKINEVLVKMRELFYAEQGLVKNN